MDDKFWDSEEVENDYMEVIVSSDSGDEHIYWVSIKNKPEDEDEYDWSIDKAVEFHNREQKSSLSADDAEALEPFSRNESEFTFIE